MRCLFDNNMPPKLAKTLSFLEGEDGIPVTYFMEKFLPDTPDIKWIEQLAKESDWFVITRDNQIRKSTPERKAWQESHIPIVFLQKSWINHDCIRGVHTPPFRVCTPRKIPYLNNIPRPFRAGLLIYGKWLGDS